MSSRILRILAALFVLAAAVNLIWPRVTGHVSKFAVVNAPVMTVRAPTNGIIITASPGLAMPVARDEVLFRMEATSEVRTGLAQLEGDLVAKQAQVKALWREETRLKGLLSDLRDRALQEVRTETDYLVQKIAEERATRRMRIAE